jgi:hypothetical protein
MPALTRKAKRRHFASPEEEEGSDNEGMVGILAQRAARRQATREADGEHQLEPQQVRFTISSYFFWPCSLSNIADCQQLERRFQ